MTKETCEHIDKLTDEFHEFMQDYGTPIEKRQTCDYSEIIDKLINIQNLNIKALEQMEKMQKELLEFLSKQEKHD